jgi:hypothetical protein
MNGSNIAGGNPIRGRVENDYYATPKEATLAILEKEEIIYPALEPACGQGHISELLEKYKTESCDLIDRGYKNAFRYGVDFLKDFGEDNGGVYNTIITNPPFSLFQEFAEKSLQLAGKKVILFGKLQALEGQKRATFMEKSPLKTVYVFKKRINPMRNGCETDENGKKWCSTMAFAWYVWEIGYTGKPTIEWI